MIMRRVLLSALVPALVVLGATVAFAQSLPPGVTQAQVDAALSDLSELYGSPVVRVDQAKAICNEEQYMVECARIGQEHGLFPKERAEQVDTVLAQLKGSVVEKMKACDSIECLVEVATTLAKNIGSADPALARVLELTPERIEKTKIIVEEAKSVGVDFEECQRMDPDTASIKLLRACAKLAKSERIQRYIPEEDRRNVEKSDRTIALKEALERGDISCGDGTIEGCGTFCLNPSVEAREEGREAIPSICRQIAERYFGPEGVGELERAYSTVKEHIKAVREYQIPDEETSETREVGTTSRSVVCPRVDYSPCPPGKYRQESHNEFGCFVLSACIPFNTKTQEEVDDEHTICPALATVTSCRSGEEKVVSFISPECGTYYSCQPVTKEDTSVKYPYTFGSGRVVLSFDEARIYCYESGAGGATARGDKAECGSTFGISVPDMPREKQQCAEFGEGWRPVDQSGNCFNEAMTEYVSPSGVLRVCSETPVYGCSNYMKELGYKGNEGQKEQAWNGSGLRSWIRTDADPARIESLKKVCEDVRSQANVWMGGAGDPSTKDFGMPDPEKCRKASLCAVADYFNGSECSKSTGGQSCASDQYWNGSTCVAREGGTVSGSCSSDLLALLGDGCHSMGNAWFNSGMTSYVLPGTKTVKSCSSDYVSGCSGGSSGKPQCSDGKDNDSDGQTDYPADSGCYGADDWSEAYESTTGSGKTQVWNSYGMQSSIREDADPSRISRLKEACANVKTSATNVWMSGAGTYSSPDFGMPDPDKCAKAAACAADQYFDGATCVSSGAGGGRGGTSSMRRCFYTTASINGRYPGYTVWCEADYYNCHEGSPSGVSVSLTGLTLGAPSSCESGWSSGSGSGGTGSGGGCGMYTTMTSCVAMSACKWENNACTYNSTSGGSGGSCGSGYYWNGSACVSSSSSGSGSSSSCGSNQYWDTRTNSCKSNESACAEAGGSWSSSSNYCTMPNQGSGSTGSSCGSGYYWNGSACAPTSSGSGSCSSSEYWDSSTQSCKPTSSSGSTSCGTGYYWNGSACAPSSGSTSGSGSSCSSTEYWDSSSNSCKSMQSACSTAGGTWDSASNYCRMSTSMVDPKQFAFACPSGQVWNGSYCTMVERTELKSFVANVLSAFSSIFGL